MSFLSNGSSHQTLSGRLDEQLHQYPHHSGNDCRTEAEHRKDHPVQSCFDAVKSRNEGSHLTLKPSKTSGYIVRPTGYFHFSPLNRTLRTHWLMIPLYQFTHNNPDSPPPPLPSSPCADTAFHSPPTVTSPPFLTPSFSLLSPCRIVVRIAFPTPPHPTTPQTPQGCEQSKSVPNPAKQSYTKLISLIVRS